MLLGWAMLVYPFSELVGTARAVGNGKNNVKEFFLRIFKDHPIDLQENEHRVRSDTFVSVKKWVILNQAIAKAHAFIDKARIKFLAGKSLKRSADSRVKQALIAHAILTAKLVNKCAVKCQNMFFR